MENVSTRISEAGSVAARLLAEFVDFIPTLVGALLLVLVGWIVARLLRSAGMKLAIWFNGLIERTFERKHVPHLRFSTASIRLFGNITFWLVNLLFVTAATRILGLLLFSRWLDQIVGYLPTLLAGGLIILVGFVISALVRDIAAAAVASAGVAYGEVLGRGAQAVVLVTALIIGINQVGIDVTLLVTLVSILFAAICTALAFAFAFGARTFVSNLIGAHYIQQNYQPGQRARLGDVEGEIVEFTPTSVIIASGNGRVAVPAKVFNETATMLLSGDTSNE